MLEENYGTKEEAIKRAQILANWSGKGSRVMVQRSWAPLWFAHLVQETWLEFLAYEVAYEVE